ncbi:MAG: anti-sigma factor [Gemmatimonadaceae bacterium]
MSHEPVRHEESMDLLPAAALEALDPEEMAGVMVHVGACESCAAELRALRNAAESMAYAAPDVPMSAERRDALRARLLARARTGKKASLSERAAAPARVSRWSPWIAAAACVLLAVSVGFSLWLTRDRSQLERAVRLASERGAALRTETDSLRALVAERDTFIAGVTGKDMAVVSLTASTPRQAWALMFWNRSTNGWTFVAHNLPQPAPGRTYQLWLVTATAKISAGTFAPSSNGEAIVRATYALPRRALKAVAVTDEPAGGVPQPTGPLVVAGSESGATR